MNTTYNHVAGPRQGGRGGVASQRIGKSLMPDIPRIFEVNGRALASADSLLLSGL